MGLSTRFRSLVCAFPLLIAKEVGSLCLLDCWRGRTVNGTNIAFGTVVLTGQTNLRINAAGCIDGGVPLVTCNPCGGVYPVQTNAPSKTIAACVYTINIDDSRSFLRTPIRNFPWLVAATGMFAR